MNNWEKNKQKIKNFHILPLDVPKEILNFLETNISKEKYNTDLAGHIKNEFKYKNIPSYVSNFFLSQIRNPLLQEVSNKTNVLSSSKPYYVDDLWINKQKKYEFNPIHDHSGIFSWIIFLKIPYNLEDEDKVFADTSIPSRTSRLCFLVHDYLGKIIEMAIDVDKSFEGKMLMFPAKLQHLVYPFYTSDKERITVSGNIKFYVEKG
jgi:hypothetical protein